MITTSLTTHNLALKHPFVTAKATITHRQIALLTLTQGSQTGCGEAAPLPGYSAESFESACQDLARIQARLTHQQLAVPLAADVEDFVDRVAASSVPSARFAFETALLDLIAQTRGTSIAGLLSDEPLSYVRVNATIAARDPRDCAQQARRALADGFTCFKLKVGFESPDCDTARIAAVRDAIGPRNGLRIDANAAWSCHDAIAILAGWQRFNIEYVEQPVAADDIEALATVRRACGIPIAADEAAHSLADLQALIDHNAIDAVVIKPMLVGGLLRARRMHQLAAEHGVTTTFTSLLDGPIARAAILQLAASTGTNRHHGLATTEVFEPPFRKRHTHAPITIPIPLVHRATHLPHHPALTFRAADGADETITYAQLYERARTIAGRLHRHGIGRHDRVAVIAPNSPHLVACIHAISLLGATLLPIHPRLTAHEARQLIARAQPGATIIAQAWPHRAALDTPHLLLEALAAAPATTDATPPLRTHVTLDEPHSLLATSGTTGTPKLALLTWQNYIFSATGSAIHLGHSPHDRWLTVLPLCHIGGLSIVFRTALYATTLVLHDGFDAPTVAETLQDGSVTIASLVPTMLQDVLQHWNPARHAPNLRCILLGGAPMTPDLQAACARLNLPIAPTYGMTEAASQVLTQPPPFPGPLSLAPGPAPASPLIWTDVAILNDLHQPKTNRPELAPPMLALKGPTLSPGYVEFTDDGATIHPITDEQGWFVPGDCARRTDSGDWEILDRRTDLIITGGENVYPAEVEAVLAQHEAVLETCVVALPDPKWGQQPVAAIVLQHTDTNRPRDELAEDLRAYCGARLASFKIPKAFYWLDELPRSSLHKVSRSALRELLVSLVPGDSDRPQTKKTP